VLAAPPDGVGTKLAHARETGRLATVGNALEARCAAAVLSTGAAPLFFQDYRAVAKVEPERVAEIVEGVAEGCRRAGCALLGGETAEHPGTMPPDQFDMAGFCVGVVDETSMLGPSRVREGDVLIGLASSGLHSNGYSLVRQALAGRSLEDRPPELAGRTLADELLEPCRIYAPRVLALARGGLVHAAAHITGGGLPENLPRALPGDLGADVERGAWPEPPVFTLVQAAAGAIDADMLATFNMGLGMVLVVAPGDAERVLATGTDAFRIGRVAAGAGVRIA
jgi:phosphoribosylformylglycinamidine cyclo-ligase